MEKSHWDTVNFQRTLSFAWLLRLVATVLGVIISFGKWEELGDSSRVSYRVGPKDWFFYPTLQHNKEETKIEFYSKPEHLISKNKQTKNQQKDTWTGI